MGGTFGRPTDQAEVENIEIAKRQQLGNMQCDNCGQEIRKYKGGEQAGEYIFTSYYGFNFCTSLFETCRINFAIKLWQAAQASKQAERKAESETPAASASEGTLVEGKPVLR